MHVLFDLTFLASQFSYIQLLKSARGLVGASEHPFPGRSLLLITMIVERMFQHIFTWANATRTAVPNSRPTRPSEIALYPIPTRLHFRQPACSAPPASLAAGALRVVSIYDRHRFSPCPHLRPSPHFSLPPYLATTCSGSSPSPATTCSGRRFASFLTS
jgi:hypothetical protein